jgi:hypothetical protein
MEFSSWYGYVIKLALISQFTSLSCEDDIKMCYFLSSRSVNACDMQFRRRCQVLMHVYISIRNEVVVRVTDTGFLK